MRLCYRYSICAITCFIASTLFATGAIASDYIVEFDSETYQVSVFDTHLEIKDSEGDIFLLSTDSSGIVELDQISSDGGYNSTLYDTNHIYPTQEEQDQYDQVMSSATVSGSGDGGGGQHPYPIISPNQSRSASFGANASIGTQSWGCATAVVNLAAAGAGVILGCGGPQGALACGVALSNYVAASMNYWDTCTHH